MARLRQILQQTLVLGVLLETEQRTDPRASGLLRIQTVNAITQMVTYQCN